MVVLICIVMLTKVIELLFTDGFTFRYHIVNYWLRALAIFFFKSSLFFLFICKCSLYILCISVAVCIANISPTPRFASLLSSWCLLMSSACQWLFVFVFLGPYMWNMEVARPGVKSELQLLAMLQPQQCGI